MIFIPEVYAYEVESDQLQIYHLEGRAIFTGNVRIWDDTGQITANRMEVYYETGGDTIKRLEAYGDVELVHENIQARAARAEYCVHSDTVSLHNDAYLKDEQGEFFADWIWLDLKDEILRMEGNIRGILRRQNGAEEL